MKVRCIGSVKNPLYRVLRVKGRLDRVNLALVESLIAVSENYRVDRKMICEFEQIVNRVLSSEWNKGKEEKNQRELTLWLLNLLQRCKDEI